MHLLKHHIWLSQIKYFMDEATRIHHCMDFPICRIHEIILYSLYSLCLLHESHSGGWCVVCVLMRHIEWRHKGPNSRFFQSSAFRFLSIVPRAGAGRAMHKLGGAGGRFGKYFSVDCINLPCNQFTKHKILRT